MSLSRRRSRTLVALLGCGIALLAAVALVGGAPLRACNTLGHANISPIQLRFDRALDVDAVEACFGPDCRPAALRPAGEGWSVPQSPEYLQGVQPGAITHVTVRASSGGAVVANDVHAVDTSPVSGFGWPQCPGPHRFVPVTIGS